MSTWKKIGAVAGSILLLGAGIGGITYLFADKEPVVVSGLTDAQIAQISTKVVADINAMPDTSSIDDATVAKINALYDNLIEEDVFKTEMYTVLMDSIADKTYKDLYNFLISEEYAIDDKEDIYRVYERDTEYQISDLDEKDGKIIATLRVKYHPNGDLEERESVDILATGYFVEGDLEDIDFEIL